MTQADERYESGAGLRPHAYFPDAQPELFDGVLGRRVVAFLVDAVIILAMTLAGWLLLLVLGILTLGLAWLLMGLVFPVVALGYVGLTLGGPVSATIGMRMVGVQMRTWYGAPMYFVLAVAHAVLFWFSISILTPFILLVGLFNDRRRLAHDFVVGTVVINKR
ncbi:MAG TPA: RDD family protein [Hyphomicrobiales bacterium]|nr:RDD family protein [Hyphomicrobiales bacterium]